MVETEKSPKQDSKELSRVRRQQAASILQPLLTTGDITSEEGKTLFVYFGRKWNIRTIASSLQLSEQDARDTIRSIFEKLPREARTSLRKTRQDETDYAKTDFPKTNFWKHGGYQNDILQPFIDNGTLHPGQAQVIHLRCQQGLLPSQIADRLQIDRLSVKKQVKSGLKKLPKEIAQELHRVRGD